MTNRSTLVELLGGIVVFSIVAGIVYWAGGPPWAAIGFAWIAFLSRVDVI